MPALPSGTVTFLFTDIEGSTARWELYSGEMGAALARHDALLREAIEANAGHVFKTVGDAFCAAFSSPRDALAAAITAQRVLAAEDWGVLGPVRVRTALHTGIAEERDGDYFGQPLNRVARLLSAGHGGQTLLSLATQELVRDTLPHNATLLDLGEHRLKDLIRPERIFQLVAPNLPKEFPPLKTLDNRPNNLPAQPTPLVGREKEIADACALLRHADVRLLTLTGPGGTGKTRLGLQVAADLLDDFKDGVFFVNLAPISDPQLVVSTIAQALGIRESGGQPLLDTLKSYLHDRQLLLLLDNFEQVVAAAPVVAGLITGAPHLKVLVTSREVLHLRGEKELAVPSLAMPDARNLPPLERLGQYESVRLFIERARDVQPSFEVTNENAPAVAEICVRLDGLPLAIELAAARIRLLTPEAMLTRLQSRLRLLTGGARDLPARQQTLRSAIEWSYDLLDDEEQKLFRRLAVFVGGRTLEAIEAVCNAEGDLAIDVLDGVDSLVGKSLLKRAEGVSGEPRFVMLETIHEYAREKLEESGEADALRRAHARYFVELAERAEPHLVSHDQVEWMDRLDEEIDNLRAVLDWSLTAQRNADVGEMDGEPERVELGLRLGAALHFFWRVRGHIGEALEKLESVLADPLAAVQTIHRARALIVAGNLSSIERRALEQGMKFGKEAVEIARATANQQVLARALHWFGMTVKFVRDTVAAEELLSEALELNRNRDDRWGIAHALGDLGWVAALGGNSLEARKLYTEALEISRQIGDHWYTMGLLASLAITFEAKGQHETAGEMYSEALQIAQELKDKRLTSRMLTDLGVNYMQQSRTEEGIALLDEGVTLARGLPNKTGLLGRLVRASFAASLAGAYEDAERWGQEYLRLSEEVKDRFHMANARANVASVYIHKGELALARKLLTEGLSAFAEMNRKNSMFECLIGLGLVAAHEGHKEKALRLWGAASAMEEVPGSLLSDTATANQYREAVERLRGEMGEAAFSRGWEEGRAMSVEEAVKHVLEEPQGAS